MHHKDAVLKKIKAAAYEYGVNNIIKSAEVAYRDADEYTAGRHVQLYALTPVLLPGAGPLGSDPKKKIDNIVDENISEIEYERYIPYRYYLFSVLITEYKLSQGQKGTEHHVKPAYFCYPSS
jgi:hypothetical protein